MNFTIYPLAYLVYRFSSALTRLSCFARSALHDSDDATFRPKLKWKRPLVFSEGPTTDMSKVGPPAAWVKEHGGTVNCPACGPKRGKANHNAECRKRYDDWLKNQRQRLERAEPTTEVLDSGYESEKLQGCGGDGIWKRAFTPETS